MITYIFLCVFYITFCYKLPLYARDSTINDYYWIIISRIRNNNHDNTHYRPSAEYLHSARDASDTDRNKAQPRSSESQWWFFCQRKAAAAFSVDSGWELEEQRSS